MALASLHLRRTFGVSPEEAPWPKGTRLKSFDPVSDPMAIHRLLAAAYSDGGGCVSGFSEWWKALSTDEEFDPTLVFVAVDPAGRIVGVAQCWTSAFVKDLAVAAEWRRRGLAAALLTYAFKVFFERGARAVNLKVEVNNPSGAVRLYQALGMSSVACDQP